jgi:predicted nuclease with TOPRIM domain
VLHGSSEKKKTGVSYSNSESKFNPSYEQLQQALQEMHVEALNAFQKLITQKKTILKLESELSQLKNDFECLKEEHTSHVHEKLKISCHEPAVVNFDYISKVSNILCLIFLIEKYRQIF